MGPTDSTDRELDEIRQRHPAWDIVAVFAGFEAVPAGTVVVRAMFIEGLDERLDELDSSS